MMTQREEEKKKVEFVIPVAASCLTSAAVSYLLRVPLMAAITGGLSMSSTQFISEKVRGKDDFWNTAAAFGVGSLYFGMIYRAKPQFTVPLAFGSSVLGGLGHLLILGR